MYLCVESQCLQMREESPIPQCVPLVLLISFKNCPDSLAKVLDCLTTPFYVLITERGVCYSPYLAGTRLASFPKASHSFLLWAGLVSPRVGVLQERFQLITLMLLSDLQAGSRHPGQSHLHLLHHTLCEKILKFVSNLLVESDTYIFKFVVDVVIMDPCKLNIAFPNLYHIHPPIMYCLSLCNTLTLFCQLIEISLCTEGGGIIAKKT